MKWRSWAPEEYLRGILSEPDRIFMSAWRYEGCMGVI